MIHISFIVTGEVVEIYLILANTTEELENVHCLKHACAYTDGGRKHM